MNFLHSLFLVRQYYKIKQTAINDLDKETYFSVKIVEVLFIYNILINLTGFLLKIIALFNKKIKLFVEGREHVFNKLVKEIHKGDQVIWFHTASLGEFEQGLPVIEQTKKEFPQHKILVTFFSPSGYEVKKNTKSAHLITYLPLDTKKNVIRFLNITNPVLAIFVKYEFWPNYLNELRKRDINTLLISAIFREKQVFFKFYGAFMRKSLKTFNHFFVQENHSKELLQSIGFYNVTVSGDTRFDRVSEILERDNSLSFVEDFKQGKLCVVAGSTWPEDEKLLADYINSHSKGEKFIIAPHNIKTDHIETLKKSILARTVLFSQKEGKNLSEYTVLIIDTIGILTKIYSYANVAYVGGGMGTSGLHNTLEPAVFGIPVIIGKNYSNFKEACELIELGGILSIYNKKSFREILSKILEFKALRKDIGEVNQKYVQINKGAKVQIGYQIRKLL